MLRETVEVRRWQIFISFAAVTIAYCVGLWLIVHVQNDVNKKNHERIEDINSDRVVSCKRTYEGVREVFRPFLPPVKKRTAEQAKDINTFNHRINFLKRHCPTQTGVEKK
jgi:hypothetical protein